VERVKERRIHVSIERGGVEGEGEGGGEREDMVEGGIEYGRTHFVREEGERYISMRRES
jgi:hypothetical protein